MKRRTARSVAVVCTGVLLAVVACTAEPLEPPEVPLSAAEPDRAPEVATSSGASSDDGADQSLYHGGVILTMDTAAPEVEALLVEGEVIVATGTLDEVRAAAGPAAHEVDLGGWAMLPGFIDSHSHRITQRFKWGFASEREATADALSQGWTGIDELALTPEELDALVDADSRGELLLRVNAYPTVNAFAGGEVTDWYSSFRPGQELGDHLRIAGLKVFIDFDSGRELLFEEDALSELVGRLHDEGWQVSMKAIGTQSHGLALAALEDVIGDGPNERRHRLEHSLAVTDAQLEGLARLGIVTAIQPGFPGVIWYDEDIRRLVAEQGEGTMFRWPDYLAAGIVAPASPYNPDPGFPEFTDASHVSPMGVLYRAVSQVGLGGSPPEPWMLDRALTVDQLLPMLTIAGAYATGVDHLRGSLTPGKLADLVVLDADPRTVPPERLLEVSVQMTMVGGEARYLRPGAEFLAPQPPSDAPTPAGDPGERVPPARVGASSELPGHPATNAVDGSPAHWNAADFAPQWLEIHLDRPAHVDRVTLDVAQDPGGPSVHELWIGRAGLPVERVHVFEGVTSDGDVLVYEPATPIRDVEWVRIVTTNLGDLYPAWREIEVHEVPDDGDR